MRIRRPADYKVMPWKNGGGTTMEIAVAPHGASMATGFDWRISMADVAGGGPFSPFPGYDRHLCVISGHGLRITGLADATVQLTPDSAAITFPGEVAIQAQPSGGPTRDFNLMVRRTFGHGVLTRMPVESPWDYRASAEVVLIHLLSGQLSATSGPLLPGDTLELAHGEALTLIPSNRAAVLLAEISRSAANGSRASPAGSTFG